LLHSFHLSNFHSLWPNGLDPSEIGLIDRLLRLATAGVCIALTVNNVGVSVLLNHIFDAVAYHRISASVSVMGKSTGVLG
jgi:hypothetical protein